MNDINWLSLQKLLPENMEDVILFGLREGQVIGFYYAETGGFIQSVDGHALQNCNSLDAHNLPFQ